MSLRTQFKSLLEPELLERLVDQTLTLKIIRYAVGQTSETVEPLTLGPFPSWFTLYEVKLALWDLKGRDPAFSPSLVFFGIPKQGEESTSGVVSAYYTPVEMIWMNLASTTSTKRDIIHLVSPISLMGGAPDTRFVDSAGGQKAIGKDNRLRMTLNDIFQLDEGKQIPEIHVFLYVDLYDRISGPRPLGERDVYGRITPYFPYLDPLSLPPSSGAGATTAILLSQADQTVNSLKQVLYLEELLQTLGGEFQMPTLNGVKFIRWVWSQAPEGWEGTAVVFFGTKVTHDRPYMRFFSAGGQPLTKIRVKGVLPIPDLPNPNLLLTWKQDKNPDVGKDCTFIKLRTQEVDSNDTIPVYATMRIFNDGTADLLVMPSKQKRLLDPHSDLQDAPEVLDKSFTDMPYAGQIPTLGQADVVFKIRLKREDAQITKTILQKRLKAFSSLFQEIPALPDEQPIAMLRYKGVSNFNNEDRIFSFLTQMAAQEALGEGELEEETWAPKVADEFKIPIDDARRRVIAWIAQRNEYTLAVPETRDYILNKNPGVDIAIFAQHPTYTLHMYRAQSFQIYTIIVNLLGLLITTPAGRFVAAPLLATVATVMPLAIEPTAVAPMTVIPEGQAVFLNDEDDDVPEFMRDQTVPEPPVAAPVATMAAPVEATGFFLNDEDDVPEFMRGQTVTEEVPVAPAPAAAVAPVAPVALDTFAPAAPPKAIQDEEDRKVAEAFKKPTDIKAIAVKKYYIDKLKAADPDLFNYERKDTSERGYVSHCAANESRQPIVLDNDEYREMRTIYEGDTDIQFVVYPEDPSPAKVLKKQPSKDENNTGRLDGKLYPSDADKELITLVRYGSKAKRIHYYFCPRLFCIRDRLMVRYKDFKATVDRNGKPKPANTCPFCKGISVDLTLDKERDPNGAVLQRRFGDPNMTVLQRQFRPQSQSERQIYIGFLGKKKTPSGLALPCCFADPSDRFDRNNPEFVRLGLVAAPGAKTQAPVQAQIPVQAAVQAPVQAQALADTIMGVNVSAAIQNTFVQAPIAQAQVAVPAGYKRGLDYYSVIHGVSVKSIVDANRIPLEIVVPKVTAVYDPKTGPQIGLLPDVLDKYFIQDSTSDKFSGRLEIVRKLKPTAKGFLRLAVDNTIQNRNQSLLSAIAPFLKYSPSAEKVIENFIIPRILPRQFLQLNGGNLVHEFFNKCEKKYQNDMRGWMSKHVSVDELKSSNIPAIERLMNSYECFKEYVNDPTKRKDLRIFFQALSEPGMLTDRGIIFIVLEVSIEEVNVKIGLKSESRKVNKLEKVRCAAYPISEKQQAADIGFLVHYNEIIHDRYTPEKKTYRHLAWEPLFYVDGNLPTSESRHNATLYFQRSQEASWPTIVQKRVSEFFSTCVSINRGPFTSQTGMDPYALISAQELITGITHINRGVIRDSYNHLVGMTYRMPGKKGISYMAAVPVADDGSIVNLDVMRVFFDWDDFDPAPVDQIMYFYETQIINSFPQYRGYVPKYILRSKDTNAIIGLRLTNGFSIPAIEPLDSTDIEGMEDWVVSDLEWDNNRTIAYDNSLHRDAIESLKRMDKKDIIEAGVAKYIESRAGDQIVQLKSSSVQDEIEDVYQHLRLTFSNWLSTAGAGRDIREALREVLKRVDLPLYEKRKRLDILLEDKIIHWLEPRVDDSAANEVGFLRVDCLVQDAADCSGRCKWASDTSTCKIHTPASIKPNGIQIQVPRLLYLRLVDELIRYASRREEIFSKQVPRLTIRKEAQRQGDQYIIPEGSSDWSSWWELLRTEWMTPEKEIKKFFDEQYEPILPHDFVDSRVLPPILKEALGASDPKTDRLVWNPSPTNADRPFFFLKSVLSNSEITGKSEGVLEDDEIKEIVAKGNVQLVYMPNGKMSGSIFKGKKGTEAIIIAVVDGVVGWISQKGTYGIKIPLAAFTDILNNYRIGK